MSGYETPAQPRTPATPERRAQILGYAAGGVGLLSFIWGFLDWYSGNGSGVAGYSFSGAGATAAIGFTVIAGLIAAARALDNQPIGVEPVVISVVALLITFGMLVGKSPGEGSVDAGVGMILQLISALIQAGILVYAWLAATGRLPAPRPSAPPAPAQWQQPPPGYQPPPPGYQPPPPGYQPPPPGYQQPPSG